MISVIEFFLKHKSKMTGDCCVFKFLQRSVDGKHLMRFQSEISNFTGEVRTGNKMNVLATKPR